MSEVMMGLGEYRFSLNTAAFQSFQRETSFGWSKQHRLGGAPAQQNMNQGDDQITLQGVIFPHFKGGLGQIEGMRAEAEKRAPLELVDGLGFVHGQWIITKLSETRKEFFADGAPKLMEFRLTLEPYGEDAA